MRKILMGLGVVILVFAGVAAYLFGSGQLSLQNIAMLLNVATGSGIESPTKATVESRFHLPPGFSISLFADNLPKVRFLRFTEKGDLIVSRPHAGDVLLIERDPENPARAGKRRTLLAGLKRPQGIDLHDGWLYIAESNAVGRVAFDAVGGAIQGSYEHLITGLSDNGNHWSKTLRIGPDGYLYLAQGSSCNVCVENDPRRAAIMRFAVDGTGGEIFATGLRNSVGMDWAPWDGALYATDNGRDLLGDDVPPCELNRVEAGRFYGWPYFNGSNVSDPDYGDQATDDLAPVAPVHEFRAHNAPLGILFVNADGLPPEYQRSALVALHGSWNRRSPDGYRVVSLHWRDGRIEERDFLSGFELNGDVIGRPVDIAQDADGALYVSDDYAGAIYRIRYGAAETEKDITVTVARPAPVARSADWTAEVDLAGMRELGAKLFATHNCAECHNDDTNARMALTSLGERLDHNGVIERLENPQEPMPLYPLSEHEMRALAVYLLSRSAN